MLFKNKIKPITLHTERFTLERVTYRQLARKTFAWSNDAELMYLLGQPSTAWTWRKWLKTFRPLRAERGICWLIYPNGSDDLIGYHSVLFTKNNVGQLTVVIKDRDWWGKQLVIETRSAIFDYIFNKTQCHRLVGMPLARNMPSIFNYQALGFTTEGVLRKHTMDYERDEMTDIVIFGILREEWLDRQNTKSTSGRNSAVGKPSA